MTRLSRRATEVTLASAASTPSTSKARITDGIVPVLAGDFRLNCNCEMTRPPNQGSQQQTADLGGGGQGPGCGTRPIRRAHQLGRDIPDEEMIGHVGRFFIPFSLSLVRRDTSAASGPGKPNCAHPSTFSSNLILNEKVGKMKKMM